MNRFRPTYLMHARPIEWYPAKSRQAAEIMMMIQNNLDPPLVQHPHGLITSSCNKTGFQNWAQYRLVMKYLCEMSDEQSLFIHNGHPLGLFPSFNDAPRCVVTNSMVIPNNSMRKEYELVNAHIFDDSSFMADNAELNSVGDHFRNLTWIWKNHVGGIGYGEVMNGGFGMLLDGSDDSGRRLRMMIHWDVNNGISRCKWACKKLAATFAIKRAMESEPRLKVTLPEKVNDKIFADLF